jgi:hypothetical protein
MKQFFTLLLLLTAFLNGQSQGISLLFKGGGASWNDPVNWVQVNGPSGQTPIKRVPTELDDIIFSGPQSGLPAVSFLFPNFLDSIEIGGNNTTGYRCRSMHVSGIQIEFYNTPPNFPTLNVHTTNGGHVTIDSGANFNRGHFVLFGGNPSITDLQILNSNYGSLFSHADWSTIQINPNGKAKFIGSKLGGTFFGNRANGGELFAENCVFTTTSFHMGDNSTTTLLNTNIENDGNNQTMSFSIGHNSNFVSANANIKSYAGLAFCTSGATLNGNVTILREGPSGFNFTQKYPANLKPNILNGNFILQGGMGTISITGDLKISGNFSNNTGPELIYPDTSHVFINGQDIFKIGGLQNYANKTFINSCIPDICHFKMEFFGNTNSNINWPVGFPIDTLIINKTGCAKVTATNSLYVSGATRIQSGQLVLNPNAGIPYKFVCAGDLSILTGGGIFLRRNVAGAVANIAVDGNITDQNTTVDSACSGLSNPYAGNITIYLAKPGSGSHEINLSGNGNIGNLDLSAGTGADFILSNPITVNNFTFRDNNRLLLGNNRMTINGSISNFGPGSYFVTNGSGSLRINKIGSTRRVFPVGPSTTAYNPVSLLNSGTLDDFSVNVAPTVLSSGTSGSAYTDSAVNRTWYITEAVPGGSKAEIRVQWNAPDELPGFRRNEAYLAHHLAGSWNYGSLAGALGSGPFTLSRDNITSFSPFAVLGSASLITAMPVFSFTIYPNPVKDVLWVKLPGQPGETMARIVDARGARVYEATLIPVGLNVLKIPLQGMPAGFYRFQLYTHNSVHTRPFLKQ